jgi:hypothetical protein
MVKPTARSYAEAIVVQTARSQRLGVFFGTETQQHCDPKRKNELYFTQTTIYQKDY